MKNIKLGDQIYEGVQTVRLDTAAGGTVDFAPYQETFAAGRVEGYNAGKEAGLEEGFDKGVKSEYDRFWDNYQENGKRLGYQRAFAGSGWTDQTFRPKYDIVTDTHYTANSMFHNADITDLVAILQAYAVILDISKAWYVTSMFQDAYRITHIPRLDLTSARQFDYSCSYCLELHTVDCIIANEACTWTGAFRESNVLTNITFEGVIGQDINFQWSPLSVDSMKSVITHLKNYSGTADAGTKTVKFTDACWAALEADGSAPDGNTWRDYVETTLGWLT